MDVVDDVVDGLGHVVDAVLQRGERVVLGVLDGVTGIVEEVVHATGDILQRVLDLAVLTGGGVTGRIDRAGKAGLDALEVGPGGVQSAAGDVSKRSRS